MLWNMYDLADPIATVHVNAVCVVRFCHAYGDHGRDSSQDMKTPALSASIPLSTPVKQYTQSPYASTQSQLSSTQTRFYSTQPPTASQLPLSATQRCVLHSTLLSTLLSTLHSFNLHQHLFNQHILHNQCQQILPFHRFIHYLIHPTRHLCNSIHSTLSKVLFSVISNVKKHLDPLSKNFKHISIAKCPIYEVTSFANSVNRNRLSKSKESRLKC